MQLIEEKRNFAAPLDVVMGVITDYERYPEFLPEMGLVRVVSRNETEVVVEFQIEFLMKVTYQIRITELPPDSIAWVLEESRMMSVNDGSWKLTAQDDGTTEVVYGLKVELKGRIPGSVSDRLTEKALPQTLERFKSRAESIAQHNSQEDSSKG
jgi:ribosome-associated toxin RatA of RatAB toxin-antitoxin module|tara:strand:- start:36 stop:497 length:462 start_codon:yes stop_codon:yes gene_type:complete